MKRIKIFLFLVLLTICSVLFLQACTFSPNQGEESLRSSKLPLPSPGEIISPVEIPFKPQWIQDSRGWRYEFADGRFEKNIRQMINGSVYEFDTDGYMKTGWIQHQKNWYYHQESGAMQTGWVKVNDHWYYLSDTGIMQTGWVNLSNQWYYLRSDGSMATGWLDLPEGRYYLKSDGSMATGWIIDDGTAFYLQPNGLYDPSLVPEPSGYIALTFDDGPGKHTSRLLDALEKNHSKATFFVLGQQVSAYKDTLLRMQALQCQIGNHTYDHKDLTKLLPAEQVKEFQSTNDLVTKITGNSIPIVRPPYGAYNDSVKMSAGQPLIFWSIDTLDWKTKNAAATIDTVLSKVSDGDIVLMHDIHSTTVDAAERLIPELITRGFKLVTVSELAAIKGKILNAGQTYSSIR